MRNTYALVAKQCIWAKLTHSLNYPPQRTRGNVPQRPFWLTQKLMDVFSHILKYFSCGQLLECLATYLFFIHFVLPSIKHMSDAADNRMEPNKKSDQAISSRSQTSVRERYSGACIISTSEDVHVSILPFRSLFSPMCNQRKMNMVYTSVNFPNYCVCYFKHDRVVHI